MQVERKQRGGVLGVIEQQQLTIEHHITLINSHGQVAQQRQRAGREWRAVAARVQGSQR